jgi:hypothetical protein
MNTFNHLKLRGAIAQSGKMQSEVAKALGLHHNTISLWTTGKAAPHPFKLIDLLFTIGWTPDELADELLVDWYTVENGIAEPG